MKRLRSLAAGIERYFLPPYCVFCRRHFVPRDAWLNTALKRAQICASCLSALPRRSASQRVIATLDPRIEESHPELAACAYPALVALEYSEGVAHAIRSLKFHERTAFAKPLGYLLHEALRQSQLCDGSEILIPLPLHPKRLRERGYNQSLLLAQVVARLSGLTLETRSLRRVKATARQSEMPDVQARIGNLHEAFVVTQPERIVGKRCILLDDVLTSGASLTSAYQVLEAAGASHILGLCIASGRR